MLKGGFINLNRKNYMSEMILSNIININIDKKRIYVLGALRSFKYFLNLYEISFCCCLTAHTLMTSPSLEKARVFKVSIDGGIPA